MRIALTDPIEPIGEAILREAGHELVPAAGFGADAMRALVADADALIVRQKLPDDIVAHGPHLLCAVRHGVGVDLIPVERCTEQGVIVANVPGANADAVAEFLVAQMLAAARHAEWMHARLLDTGWSEARARTAAATELTGKTLGIIGMGAIGSRLAEIAGMGFRMRVLGHRRGDAPMPAPAQRASLAELFTESDYIALACPLTPETRGLVGAELLARMKPTAWLLNVARGPVVQEAPLVEALRDRRIGGAALDVFWEQPLPADHPLRTLDNVLLSPHGAGITQEAATVTSRIAAEEVVRILAGQKPRNFINPEAWPAAEARRAALGHP